MRPWRKLYSSILESERFADVPPEAKVLFFLLVAAQDDTGYYPWERLKIRRLTAACSWSEDRARAYAQALVDGGMASWDAGGIILRKGQSLNGHPRDDRKPFLYQRHATDMSVAVSGQPTPVTVLREMIETETERETEREKEEGTGGEPGSGAKAPTRARPKRVTVVDPEFIERMERQFALTLGGSEAVREQVQDAVGHKAFLKWDDKQRYVLNWLRRNSNGRVPDAKPERATGEVEGKPPIVYRTLPGQPLLGSRPPTMLDMRGPRVGVGDER